MVTNSGRQSRLLNDVTLTKGSFTLFDKLTNTPYPSSTWTFLFNPELITCNTTAAYNSTKFSGGNYPFVVANGIASEVWSFTLHLTGDTPEEGRIEENQGTYSQQYGTTSLRITPATDSQIPSSEDATLPNVFSEFGKRNMVPHVEHLRSLMMYDTGRDWRILFDYGNIVNNPHCFIMTNLNVNYAYLDSDLAELVYATCDVELMVDSADLFISRAAYLNQLNHVEAQRY